MRAQNAVGGSEYSEIAGPYIADEVCAACGSRDDGDGWMVGEYPAALRVLLLRRVVASWCVVVSRRSTR